MSGVCALAGRGGCWGRLHDHHLIKRSHLRDWLRHLRALPSWHRANRGLPDPEGWSLERLVADQRNQIKLCVQHHLGDIENARAYIERDELPEECVEFAGEIGMGWYIDRYYPEGRRAA